MLHCLKKKNKTKEGSVKKNCNFSVEVMKSTPVLFPFVSFTLASCSSLNLYVEKI